MEQDIFYPNKLTKEEIENLEGWKLKVAAMHFGRGRGDCVTMGYGYKYRPEQYSDSRPDYDVEESNTIILVGDKDRMYKQPISLRNEIDWNSNVDLLSECGLDINTVLRNHITEQVDEWFSED